MRRILICLVSLGALIGCENHDESSTSKTGAGSLLKNSSNDCANSRVFQDYLKAESDGLAEEWIALNGQQICDENLYDCVEQSHRIDSTQFNTYASNHSSNSNGIVSHTKTWQDVEDLISNVECYDKYLILEVNQNNLDMSLGLFSKNYTAYSAVLMLGIKNEHNLQPSDTISFVQAMVPSGSGTKDSIIFKVVKNGFTTYYDYSKIPA